MNHSSFLFPLLCLAAAWSCSSETSLDDAAPGDGDDHPLNAGAPGLEETPMLRGGCNPERRHGAFVVGMEPTFTAVSGRVSDGIVPADVLQLELEEGECRILRKLNPLCDPACESDETCNLDGECVPFPAPQDVGEVEIVGLEQAVAMTPLVPGYNYSDTTLSHPGFQAGAAISLGAEGGELSGFQLYGTGVPELKLSTDELTLKKGEPFSFEWESAEGEQRVRLVVKVDLHGLSPVRLECTTDDSGSFSVPASLVDALVDFGVSGFPSADFYRETIDSREVAGGCVEFSVVSHVGMAVDVAGHIPCRTAQQCPLGATCDVATETCVEPQ